MNSLSALFDGVRELKSFVRAFRYRNYRLFFTGQGISLIGTWMQMVAVSWLIYRLTQSPFALGALVFANQIPTFLLAPIAGVLADHFDRRHILLVTQTLSMLQAGVLTALVFTEAITVRHLFLLSAALGMISAFDIPARQAFVFDIVEKKEDIANAIALNSFMFNGARLIGPAIAGLIIVASGERLCFLINAISFLTVILALGAMRMRPREVPVLENHIIKRFTEGMRYTFGSARIRYILIFVMLVSLLGMSYMVLMPIFAREVLRGDAHTFGFLMGSSGLGSLIGALYLASRRDTEGLERLIYISGLIFGAAVISFSFSRVLWLSLPLMLIIGFGLMMQLVSSNTMLQHITDDDKRGRVMSFYAMAFLGMAPFGGLLAGTVADAIGAPNTLLISGLSCIAGAVFFLRKEM